MPSGGAWQARTPEDGTIAVSDAKRKIQAKRLTYIALLIFLIVGIGALYNGVGHLYRYLWWHSNFNGEYTETGMWTQDNLQTNVVLGSFFLATGVLGIIGFILLFMWAIPAINQDNKGRLRTLALPLAVIGLIPSPGLVIAGLFLFFVWRMYTKDDFDLFGLLLEDVPRGRPRPFGGPEPVGVGAGGGDVRAAYATGYVEQQSIYADDYARAAYGGGSEAYGEVAATPQPAAPMDLTSAPLCSSCGKPTEWIEEYQRYYCYDCDRYV
jgi:hypothetical protein